MTEQQDVLSPKRRRRHGNTILLGSIPVAVALTALLSAGWWATAPVASVEAAPQGVAADAPEALPLIVAPKAVAEADSGASIRAIKVILPPAPKKAAAQPTASAASQQSTTTAKKATSSSNQSTAKKSTKKSSKKKSVNFESYCANPKSPYGASGGPKALLSAANKERARLGIKQMSWNSSLASAATKWSKNLAAADSKTKKPADKLAHNPNRPGGENVAVSYVSSGLGQGGAISRAHSNWMYSSGHCKNIMNPSYSSMGAGAAQTSDGTTWYTTENFR